MVTSETQQKNMTKTLNPYPGLRPFRNDESHLFFGRENQVQEVLDKLIENRFIAIVGTSGIGKSSFMYCGVMPNLTIDYQTHWASQWESIVCRPGEDPIKNLSKAIAPLNTEETSEDFIYASLCENSKGLINTISPLYAKNQKNYLVFIDQFEELFRFQNNSNELTEESSFFIKLLVEAIEQSDVPIYVIITLRSDFIGDCSVSPSLTEHINDSQFLIPQMTREEKRLAITGPAAVMGATIDEPLVEEILNEVSNNLDSLPVMQHTLMRMWQYWQENASKNEPIQRMHYNAIGGLHKALSIHANQTFNELDEHHQAICEKVFKAITEKNGDRRVRRPTKFKDIVIMADARDENDVKHVIEHFRAQGKTLLMPPSDVKIEKDTVIDISHESLMRIWELLGTWVDEEAESAKLYLRLSEAAELHQEGKTGLWRPPDLQLALNWREEQKPTIVWGVRYHPAFERTMLFLEHSERALEQEQKRKEKQQKRRLFIARMFALILGLGGLISFLFYLRGNVQREVAIEQTKIAKIKSEEAEAQAKIAKEKEKEAKTEQEKAKIAAEKAEKAAEEATRQAEIAQRATAKAKASEKRANAALIQARISEKAARDEREISERMRMINLAQTIANKSHSADYDTLQALMAQQAYKFHKEYDGDHNAPDIYSALYDAVKKYKGDKYNKIDQGANIRSIQATRVSEKTFAASSDGQVFSFSPNFGEGNTQTTQISGVQEGQIHKTMAISPFDTYLAVGGDYDHILLYNLQKSGNTPVELKSNFKETWYLHFTSNDSALISCSNDHEVLYWKGLHKQKPTSSVLLNSKERINTLAVNPMNDYAVLGKNNGDVTLVNIKNPSDEKVIFTAENHNGVYALDFDFSGTYLAIGDEKGLVYILNMETFAFHKLKGHKARVNCIRFNDDNSQLATASFDKTVKIWDPFMPNKNPINLTDHKDWVWSIEFSGDGSKLLAGCRNGDLNMWPTNYEDLANILCSEAKRNMTDLEWKKNISKEIEREETCLDYE